MKPEHPASDIRGPVLVYDFNASGHCPGWMYLAAAGFRMAGAEVVACCRTGDAGVRPWADRLAADGCRVVAMPEGDFCHAGDAAALARREGIQRVFFPNFDSVVYEMGKRRVRGALDGLDVGGIWLRPELRAEPRGPLRRLVEKLVRSRANKLQRKHARAVRNNHRGLADFLPDQRRVARVRLFFTSEAAARDVGALMLPGEERMLCDPWLDRCRETREQARAALDLDPSRVVLLHIGTSRPEKGLDDTCQAMLSLAPDARERLLLLRVGTVDQRDATQLRRLEQTGAARVIDRHVAEDELLRAYAACDRVLLPYRHQKETSGVLVHAAAHDRPVIASDHGWIGKATREHAMGMLVPHCDTHALAAALDRVARGQACGWSADGIRKFAAANSPDRFRKTLVDDWLRHPPDPPPTGR